MADVAAQGLTRSMRAKSALDGLDRLKGLVFAAADESENAYEMQDGALFSSRLLQQLAKPAIADFKAAFQTTRSLVLRESGHKQTPTALGNLALAEALRLR